MGKVSVRVPATSANMGPGFDVLGCAFDLYNVLSFEETGGGLEITGCSAQYAGADNLAARAYFAVLDRLGEAWPRGLRIHIASEIPVSRGLGSSAALTVAGAAAANSLHGGALSKRELLAVCCALEGHPDNAAPAIYGGLTAAVMRRGEPVTVGCSVCPSLSFAAAVPDFEVSTEAARAAMPETVPTRDAAYTLGCLALLLKGLETGDPDVLRAALDDRLHQPYRKKMIPFYDNVRAAALEAGALGLVISGSGSSCLCVCGDAGVPKRLRAELSRFDGAWRVYPLKIDLEGAVVSSL